MIRPGTKTELFLEPEAGDRALIFLHSPCTAFSLPLSF